MLKRKISKKPVRSLGDMSSLSVKNTVYFVEFKASKRMRNKKYVFKALLECLMVNDTEGFKEILRAYLELVNKEEFAKKAGIPRRTLFRMLSKTGNPTLKNISRIIFQLSS